MDAAVSAKPSLTVVRRIKAPPEKVFAWWTDADLMARWFCPEGITLRAVESDPRLGGRYRIVMQEGADGEVHDVSGTFREVEPGRKLVFSWAWVTTPERESLVTVELVPVADGTELTLTHSQLADERARDSHREGWSRLLPRLAALIEGE